MNHRCLNLKPPIGKKMKPTLLLLRKSSWFTRLSSFKQAVRERTRSHFRNQSKLTYWAHVTYHSMTVWSAFFIVLSCLCSSDHITLVFYSTTSQQHLKKRLSYLKNCKKKITNLALSHCPWPNPIWKKDVYQALALQRSSKCLGEKLYIMILLKCSWREHNGLLTVLDIRRMLNKTDYTFPWSLTQEERSKIVRNTYFSRQIFSTANVQSPCKALNCGF